MSARSTDVHSKDFEADNLQLVDALRAIHSKYHSLKKHTTKQFELLQSGGEELQETRKRLASLQKELDVTKTELERTQSPRAGKDVSRTLTSATDCKSNQGSRYNKMTKSDYRHADYRDALVGMEQELIKYKAAAAELEENNAALALRIVELERHCAELDGRRAERDDSNSALRAALESRDEELERLGRYVSRMQKELAELNSAMRSGKIEIDPGHIETIAQDDETSPGLKSLNGRSSAATSAVTELIPAKRPENNSQWRAENYDDLTGQADIEQPIEPLSTAEVRQLRNETFNDVFTAASSANHFVIVPVGDSESDLQYPLKKDELTIGRSRDNDIPVADHCVSRVHARVVLEDRQVFIEDMGSKNGILVNGKRRERHQLQPGDRFAIGRMEFELVDSSSS